MSPADRQQPHRRCTNPACAAGHAHCETCGASSSWPCPPIAAAEHAVHEAQITAALSRLVDQIDAHLATIPHRRRLPMPMPMPTEGSTR